MARRSWWGWGDEGEGLPAASRNQLAMMLGTQFDVSDLEPLEPPPLDGLTLPANRVLVPDGLSFITEDLFERASHCHGKAFRDVVRNLRGDMRFAPDAVAVPPSVEELVRLLEWADAQGYAVIPYGGGSSVVGGIEARCRDAFPGVLSVDLRELSAVHAIDHDSRAAHIGAGIYGPALEAALAPKELTLRHYPQSFQFSTLGGWIATRAGGHFATLHTHIDDFVESMTVVTPRGEIVTRRLPGSGAGPSPDRLFLGSEGALGIITSAWIRLLDRPTHRCSQTLAFADFYDAASAARQVAQAGLYPAMLRLLDPMEALINGLGDGVTSFLLLGFESADHPLDQALERAVTIAKGAGGKLADKAKTPAAMPTGDLVGGDGDDAASRWKKMFLRGGYLRDALTQMGMVVETFETAITWDRFETYHRRLIDGARDAAKRVCGGAVVTSRITHVYPDGAAPYFTVIGPAKADGAVAQWDEIKAAVSELIIDGGGTITHHHAVGRDHRPWYDKQRPDLFGEALVAAKKTLDPKGILNPGCLVG